ncbi:MAG: BatD family protein [Bdellovibrionia bacterium]
MRNHKVLRKTGSFGVVGLWGLSLLLNSTLCFAADLQFSAQVDEPRVALDATVSLKMLVRSDSNTMAGEPQFQAPDFEVVNEYKSISVESRYDSTNGGLSMQNTQQITKVLRPLKTGALKISGIQLNAGGKAYKAPDIQIHVIANSPGAPVQGGGALRRGNPQAAGNKNVAGASTLVRAEVDKKTAHKGEQIIVSYYLYHRVKIFNIQVEKFPVLSGFLREDLEMPVMGQRLDSEQVVLNGIPYERSLLARYAAYPLEEGKLSIDSISLRFNYYAGSRNNTFDDEDPFFGFFQQMAPRVGSGQSERLEVDVVSLPAQGKTEKFTGGIGEFNVISTVDKYEVRANEAITLSVKVEGRGNIAAIQAPQAKWPPNIELYDTKGKSQGGRGGVGEKIFEFLLIPRVPGQITLTPLEFEFFDPVKKQYYTKSTEAVQIKVLDPAPGTSLVPAKQPTFQTDSKSQDSQQSTQLDEMRYLKAPGADLEAGFNLRSAWRFLFWGCGLILGLLVFLIGVDLFRGGKKKLSHKRKARYLQNSKSWENLSTIARAASNGGSWKETTQAYEILCGIIFDALDRTYQISSRAISRSELKTILVGDRGMPEESWQRVDQLLEFSDLVRFASSAGGVSESTSRNELAKWVTEGRAVVQLVEKNL